MRGTPMTPESITTSRPADIIDAISQPLRLVLIIRTSKRKRDARSPKQQRDIAKACAKSHGHRIVRVLDSGTDESGKTMNRAPINEAMKIVKRGEADGVIVALADRLGRAKIEEAMATVRDFCTHGKLVLADMGGVPLDLNNSVEEFNITVLLGVARMFWLGQASRFLRSQRDAVKDGRFCGPTPFGYERRDGRLHEHETYGPVVRECYRRAARDGIAAAVAYLREAAPVRPAAGERKASAEPWNTDSVRKLLKSRVYLGESAVRARRDESGKPVGRDRINENAHDALTTPEHFIAAQSAPRPKRAASPYPLSSIATCAECERGLHGQLASQRGGKTERRYRCSNKRCGGGSSISADALDQHVRAELARVLGDPTLRTRVVPGNLEDAQREVQRTRGIVEAHIENTDPRAPGYKRILDRREDERRAAEAHHDEIAAQHAVAVDTPAPDQLHKPAEFDRALRVVIAAGMKIVVARGRGEIRSRVGFGRWLDDLDDAAGALAA